jgi:hypothetical protein
MVSPDALLPYSQELIDAVKNAGFKTVEEYVENSENIPLTIAEEYVSSIMSYPWYNSESNNNRLYKLFHEASSWEDANRLAGTVKKHFTPKPSMVEPNGRIYREYENFNSFIIPRLLINKHTPEEYITLIYNTTDFNIYNPKEENHPLNIISSHLNTPAHILTQIALTPVEPIPTNKVDKVAQEANITFNIIQNINTPYEILFNPDFHNRITSQVLSKMLLLNMVERPEYNLEHLKQLVYSTDNKYILNEIRAQLKTLMLDETEETFIVLTVKILP